MLLQAHIGIGTAGSEASGQSCACCDTDRNELLIPGAATTAKGAAVNSSSGMVLLLSRLQAEINALTEQRA